MTEVEVLVVGAGPVGSALCVELSMRGVRCLAVERQQSLNPDDVRAMNLSMRTLEHFRRWGAATELRGQAMTASKWQRDVCFCTSLLGRELATFPAYGWRTTDARPLAAEPSQILPQPATTDVLRRRATELGAGFLTGWECVALEQSSDSIRATVRDPQRGLEHAVSARYCIGCDGGRSVVRSAAGISRSGTRPSQKHFLTIVRVPGLLGRVEIGPAGFFLTWGGQNGFAVPLDDERWSIEFTGFSMDEEIPEERQRSLVRSVIGAEDDFEILLGSAYQIEERIADTYRNGRLLIAGDAAHLWPPYGGHNLNTGIGDAVDLGWKLAAVLHDWGGEALLDSYTAERRPMALRNARASTANVGKLYEAATLAGEVAIPSGDSEHEERERRDLGEQLAILTRQEWMTAGVVLDLRYVDSPVIVDDGRIAAPWRATDYQPCAKPGHRLPHAWLSDGSSIFDHCGPELTLLSTRSANDNVERIERAANRAAIPLTVAQVPEPMLEELYESPLVLLRPDQHVAWRDVGTPIDPAKLLATTCGRASGGLPLRDTASSSVANG